MHLSRINSPGSARQQIDIKRVEDGIIVFPGKQYRRILEVSSLNFELKSDSEQDAIIETYKSFLNGLGLKIQVLVRIREIDLDDYLNKVSRRSKDEIDDVWRQQLSGYVQFVSSLVNVNRILSRTFFIVIPLDDRSSDFDFIKEQLALKAEIVSKGLQRLGMQSRPLSSLETLNLFYSFYNPQQAKLQPLSITALKTIHSILTIKDKK